MPSQEAQAVKNALIVATFALVLGACQQDSDPSPSPAPTKEKAYVVSQYCKEVDPTGMNNLLVLVWSDGHTTFGGTC